MQVLPVGTVTFLLTDVAGSTATWENEPEAMRLAMVRLDMLAATIIPAYSGVVVKQRGEGDSLFCVFARAGDAVLAACELQRALHQETWPTQHPIRVRIGIHTGDAEFRDRDYYGPTVNRCARLRAVGHGGQTLLSRTVYDLTRDTLPDFITLKDLGKHRLKDLQRPEQIFQVVHPDLPNDYPPLQSLDSAPNNLPQQTSSFIGREREMAEVKALLQKTRLLTLVGSGGAGKTRLSLQVAADRLEDFRDGVFLIELAALSDPTLVPQAVALAIGVREDVNRPTTQQLLDYLQARRVLLILDNCEHVLDACANLCATLLRSCRELVILASSREGMNIAGEVLYRVPSLSLPSLNASLPVEALTQYEAVRLFIDRAIAVRPEFTVTNANAPAIAQLCWRLDGIPMAIELAAARVRVMTVEQIAARLDDRFRLLTGGSRVALPRQQTLRALVDWSYDLLVVEEQILLQRLAVFAGGWTLAMAEAVCPDPDSPLPLEDWEILDYLARLVDKSLVVYDTQSDRYHFMETIRQYALERLQASGEESVVRIRHRDAFLSFAQRIREGLFGPEQQVGFARLEVEHDNLRAAIAQSVEEPLLELEFARALGRFWDTRGYIREGKERLTHALEQTQHIPNHPHRAPVLMGLAWIYHLEHNVPAMRACIEEAKAIYILGNDPGNTAFATLFLGDAAKGEGDIETAFTLYSEALARYRPLNHAWGIAVTLTNLGELHVLRGEIPLARPLLMESLERKRQMGDTEACGITLYHLTTCDIAEGAWEVAHVRLQECIDIFRSLGARLNLARALDRAAEIAAGTAQWEEALHRDAEATQLYVEIGLSRSPSEEQKRLAEREAWQAKRPAPPSPP